VASVQSSCVGCGLCGEVAHAAVLCPSFYRVELVSHPKWLERKLERFSQFIIGRLQRKLAAREFVHAA
jgi:indolepyruvate ferredoxin oxidoreductase alpha subunit